MPLTHVSELLEPGQSALCIFTRGMNFHVGQDGHGTTGHWVIDPNHPVDFVMLYLRQEGANQNNEVYTAHVNGYEGPDEEHRFNIQLIDIVLHGATTVDWCHFCDTGQNPIRYYGGPVLAG
jgi:hypothetical protein